jgi:hypothetical protein
MGQILPLRRPLSAEPLEERTDEELMALVRLGARLWRKERAVPASRLPSSSLKLAPSFGLGGIGLTGTF